MTNWTTLPHETLAAYQVACELLVAVKKAEIADLKLRDQALRAAKSVCLNSAYAEFGISDIMPHAGLCRTGLRAPR